MTVTKYKLSITYYLKTNPKNMKKLYALTVCVLLCLAGSAQTYAPWEPSQGPLNFMTLDVQNHPYIRVSYNNTQGILGYGTQSSHQLITSQATDTCRCLQVGTNYVHENYLPQSWSGIPGETLDTVIRLGCSDNSNTCRINSQIEYWFYPQVGESTLLVYFSFAEEDVPYHSAAQNPRFYVEVLDGQTEELIPGGYYPTEASNGTQNEIPNPDWPYNRFLAVPSGNQATLDHYTSPNDLGISTYYWAFPQATPTTFPYNICPNAHNGPGTDMDVHWMAYKTLAFDLSSYAAQGKSVKLRIQSRTCQYAFHWAYALFAAKMVQGVGGTAIATDVQPVFHLSAPWGFLEQSYEWHYGYDSLDAASRPELDILSTPGITEAGPYDIFIDPDAALAAGSRVWPYYRCEMLSYTNVPFVFEYWLRKYHVAADFSYQPEIEGDAVQFQNLSTVCCSIPTTESNAGWDTVYEDGHLRWYVLENEAFTLFAENESNPSFTFTPATVSDGEATVMLVVSDSLNQVSDTVVRSFPMSLTGIPAHERGSVTVTPNPTRGTVRVSADRDIENVRILTADGKLLNTVTLHDRATTLDLGHYDGNLFLIEVRFKDGSSVVKKVVKR